MHAAGIGNAFTHQVFHLAEVIPQFVFVAAVVHQFGTQLHARDRGLQVVGNRRQQLHAFFQIGRNARLHGIEGDGSVCDFGRALFIQMHRVSVGIKVFHGLGQSGQRAYGNTHSQPRA